MTLQSACESATQRESFDILFRSYFPGDPDGQIRQMFDVLKAGNKALIHPYDLMYLFAFGAKHREDDFETIAAMAAAVLSQNF